MIKKTKEFLYDSSIDVQDRLFYLISIISLFGLLGAIVIGFFIGENTEGLVGTFLVFLFLLLVVTIGKRKNKLVIAANGAAFILIFISLPYTYFTSGGVYGGTPIWFLFVMIFVGMVLKKHEKVAMIIAECLVALACYTIQYFYPATVMTHYRETVFFDSIFSFYIVGIILTILLSFQTFLYRIENNKANKQREEIEDLNKAQNRFFSSMSHEIRTPINTIIGLNEMILREQNISDEVAEDAANIQSASNMLLHLINDILDMSKIQSGQMELTENNYFPGDILSDIVGMLWIKANEKDLDFKISVAPDIPKELFGDEMRIKQILINVINNAIKYTSQGYVSLEVSCRKGKDNTTVMVYSVSDSGIGIKKENIPYLFNAFKRVDEDKNRNIEGTGLGLSIVKQLIDLMGGKITVNSVYTKGSTFIIEIPQQVINSGELGDINIGKNKSNYARAAYKQKFEAPDANILVVDDTKANLMVVQKLLKKTQVKIDTASNGIEALDKTLKKKYDVIFMDHLMPEMNGIDCLHSIRNQIGGLSKESRVIALTANAGSDMQKLYMGEGFDGYLVKPISGDALERALYNQLPGNLVKETGSPDLIDKSFSWVNDHTKKANVVITTDSPSDIPKEIIDKYNIAIISFKIKTDDGVFKVDDEIEANGLLAYMRMNESSGITTLFPSVDDYSNFFAEQLMRAHNILHLSTTSKIYTHSYESAVEAAGVFENVTLYDTEELSTGQGMMVIKACELAVKGYTIAEIIEELDRYKKKVRTTFVVDTLDLLVKQKQISPFVSNIAKAFMIRPVIKIKKGRMKVGSIYIGSRLASWEKYIYSVLDGFDEIDHKVLYVTYIGLSQSELKYIAGILRTRPAFDKVYFVKSSTSIAINCGPGTFGLLYETLQ